MIADIAGPKTEITGPFGRRPSPSAAYTRLATWTCNCAVSLLFELTSIRPDSSFSEPRNDFAMFRRAGAISVGQFGKLYIVSTISPQLYFHSASFATRAQPVGRCQSNTSVRIDV